ncbi:hypothetical protein SOVF_212640, partial [Spinacia oleracea]
LGLLASVLFKDIDYFDVSGENGRISGKSFCRNGAFSLSRAKNTICVFSMCEKLIAFLKKLVSKVESWCLFF